MVAENKRGISLPRNNRWRGKWRSAAGKVAAVTGIATIAATMSVAGLDGSASSASAAVNGPWTHSAGYGFGDNGENPTTGGFYAGNFTAGDGSVYVCAVDGEGKRPSLNGFQDTSYGDPQVVSSWTGNSSRWNGSSSVSFIGDTLTGKDLAAVAYINSVYAGSGDDMTAASATAAHYRLFGMYEDGPYSYHTSNHLPAGVETRSAQMVNEAVANAGPYVITDPLINLNGGTGSFNNLGIRGSAGTWLAGYPMTATITSGNATWNGAQSGTVWTGTTESSARSLNFTATESGPVNIKVSITMPDDRVWVATSSRAGAQKVFATSGTRVFEAAADPVDAQLDFQPTLDSHVREFSVAKGETFGDVAIVGVEAGEAWIPGVEFTAVAELVEYADGAVAGDAIPSDATVLDRVEFTVNGPGEYPVESNYVAPADKGGMKAAWQLYIRKADQSETNAKFLRSDATHTGYIAEETSVVQADIIITTERELEFQDDETVTTLVDNVTVELAPGDVWPTDLQGNAVEVKLSGDVLYAVHPHAETPADQPAPGDVVGNADLVFTAPGTQAVEVELSNGGAKGAYTWQWESEASDYFTSFKTPSWELVETTTFRHQITHHSIAREYNVAPGGRAFDTITIGGFPGDHGAFAGVEGWAADKADADVVVYYNGATQPEGADVPETATVFWQGTMKAGNLVANIGYDDADQISPTEPGYYVFVYDFAGDSRTAPFASDFDDVLERFYVPSETPPAPEKPTAITQADKAGLTDTEISDTALVQGDVPEGSVIVFEAYHDEGNLTCDVPAQDVKDALYAAGPYATTSPIAVTGSGYYKGTVTAPSVEGSTFWVETLYGPKDTEAGDDVKPGEPGWDEILDQGDIGTPGECTKVTKPERDIKVSTTLKHDGDQETGPVVGDNIWDEITVNNPEEIVEGDFVEVELYIWDDAENPVCDAPVWVSERIDLVPGQAVYETNSYTTVENGTHGFVEVTRDADGELLSRGECGDPNETITVNPQEDEAAGAANSSGGSMAETGAGSAAVLAGAAALLTAAGGAGVMIRRRANLES